MSKLLSLSFVAILLVNNAFAQTTSSPYSLFAEGRIIKAGTGTNLAMGGTGIALKSKYYLNNLNPASYSDIDSLSFLLETGVFGSITQFKTNDEIRSLFNGNITYLAMGFRFTRWWATSFGIVPYSSVGYKITALDNVEGDLTSYIKTFEGNGGINEFYWSHSVQPLKNLSAGISLSYYLGSITRTETGTTIDDYLAYSLTRTEKVHSYNFKYGAQYSFPFNTYKIIIGAIFTEHKNLNSDINTAIHFEEDTIDLTSEKTHFYIPRRFGAGFALEKGTQLRAGFDYEKSFWPENHFTNPLLRIRDGERFSIGIEYTPYKGRGDQDWKKIFFRIGGTYNKSYLIIDKVPVNSTSFTLGVGIPVGRELNMINLSLEAGRTGTKTNGLIEEDFLLLHVNFTLHDKWFINYKIK